MANSDAVNEAHIPAGWRPFVRVMWLVVALLLLAIAVIGIPHYFGEVRAPCAAADCNLLALSPREAHLLQSRGVSLEQYAGYLVGANIYALVLMTLPAGLIFWRRSDTWMGFLISILLLYFGSTDAPSQEALAAAYPTLVWPLFILDGLGSVLFVLLFYVFPDGRFVPRWSRLIVIVLIGGSLIELLLTPFRSATPSFALFGNILWLGSLLVGVLAQVYRYRSVSGPTQRQQTKWIMFGLVVVFTVTLTWTLLFELFPLQAGSARLILKLSVGILVLLFTILPITLVFSILRYRLWDIDVVINRTLVYGLLSAILVAVYFVTVVLLQSVLRSAIGQESPLAVVLSTLLIAALFAPLRRRLQVLIDRRFYRRKYDAAKTLAAFGAIARDEVELEGLTAALMNVIDKTMQPASSSLWLVPSLHRDGKQRADGVHGESEK